MKKALRETQTLRAKNSPPPAADPLPGGTGPPKFNQLEVVTTFTYRPSLVKICYLVLNVFPSIHPSMYLLAKCQHNANNNAIDNAKWSTKQKRETLC